MLCSFRFVRWFNHNCRGASTLWRPWKRTYLVRHARIPLVPSFSDTWWMVSGVKNRSYSRVTSLSVWTAGCPLSNNNNNSTQYWEFLVGTHCKQSLCLHVRPDIWQPSFTVPYFYSVDDMVFHCSSVTCFPYLPVEQRAEVNVLHLVRFLPSCFTSPQDFPVVSTS